MSEDPGRYAGKFPRNQQQQGGKPKGMPVAQAMDLLNNVKNWGALALGVEHDGPVPVPPLTPGDKLYYARKVILDAGKTPPVSEALIAALVLSREGRVGGSLRTMNRAGRLVTLHLEESR